jgi:hypothetical protein
MIFRDFNILVMIRFCVAVFLVTSAAQAFSEISKDHLKCSSANDCELIARGECGAPYVAVNKAYSSLYREPKGKYTDKHCDRVADKNAEYTAICENHICVAKGAPGSKRPDAKPLLDVFQK